MARPGGSGPAASAWHAPTYRYTLELNPGPQGDVWAQVEERRWGAQGPQWSTIGYIPARLAGEWSSEPWGALAHLSDILADSMVGDPLGDAPLIPIPVWCYAHRPDRGTRVGTTRAGLPCPCQSVSLALDAP